MTEQEARRILLDALHHPTVAQMAYWVLEGKSLDDDAGVRHKDSEGQKALARASFLVRHRLARLAFAEGNPRRAEIERVLDKRGSTSTTDQ